MKVEGVRSEHNKKDACPSKESACFDEALRQNDPSAQKLEETPGSTNSTAELTCGQTSPNSSLCDNAVLETKPAAGETPLVSNPTVANLSKAASKPTEKPKLDLHLSQNTSADVEMLSPESPTCKSILCNSSGERPSRCAEPHAPCAQSSSSVESTDIIDPRGGAGTVSESDATAMETDNSDISGGNSLTANEDSSGNTRYTHSHM